MASNLLNELSATQRTAANSTSHALQILAGPGSGKTRVLTSRVAWLIQIRNVDPSGIVIITFTDKAAKEMRERLVKLTDQQTVDLMYIGTIHHMCSRMLREHITLTNRVNSCFFKIVLPAQTREILHQIKNERVELRRVNVGNFIENMRKWRNLGIYVQEYCTQHVDGVISLGYIRMFQEYEARLERMNSIDFDNLQVFALELLQDHPGILDQFAHVLIDEFQDTNEVQYDILKCFMDRRISVTVVGDPDQNIFSFRCTSSRVFQYMHDTVDNVQVITMDENYRSTQCILAAATHVIQHNQNRLDRAPFTRRAQGVPISVLQFSDERAEAEGIASEIKHMIEFFNGLITYNDIAILVRVGFLAKPIIKALKDASIPIGDIKNDNSNTEGVTIATMHKAKGLEWACVFLPACEDGFMPHYRAQDTSEECRLLYVAMTRAKAFLYCTCTQYRRYIDREGELGEGYARLTSFLRDMPDNLCNHSRPKWDEATMIWVANLLGKPIPVTANTINDEEETLDELFEIASQVIYGTSPEESDLATTLPSQLAVELLAQESTQAARHPQHPDLTPPLSNNQVPQPILFSLPHYPPDPQLPASVDDDDDDEDGMRSYKRQHTARTSGDPLVAVAFRQIMEDCLEVALATTQEPRELVAMITSELKMQNISLPDAVVKQYVARKFTSTYK